jgi:hypothetical protein
MSTVSKVLVLAVSLGTGLWTTTALAKDPPGARPGDDKMSCEEIATELQPYVQQLTPGAVAAGETAQELKGKAEKHMAEEAPKMAALSAMSIAAGLDPTGLSQRAANRAIQAEQKAANERVRADTQPVGEKLTAQTQDLAAQAQQMQANPRLMRLMDLAQKKGCDKKK